MADRSGTSKTLAKAVSPSHKTKEDVGVAERRLAPRRAGAPLAAAPPRRRPGRARAGWARSLQLLSAGSAPPAGAAPGASRAPAAHPCGCLVAARARLLNPRPRTPPPQKHHRSATT
jgi:hypothetical protein